MRDKKIILLAVLAVAAVISLTYGLKSSSQAREKTDIRLSRESPEVTQEFHSLAPLVRPARKDEFASWERNPFMPWGLQGGASSAVTLNGIAWDPKNPKAVINDRIVGVGDEIAGYRIVEIKPASVVLSGEEGNRELRV
ncbi:MAG: hypothetical protein HYU34_00610 [Candidatus Omnitrophica bacterium]|nr:hypothetical protein [Candidatus Omnitrophota bacterium]